MGAYSSAQMSAFFVGLALSLVCIRLSWRAVMRRDVASFLNWHALWHAGLPLTAVCIACLEGMEGAEM